MTLLLGIGGLGLSLTMLLAGAWLLAGRVATTIAERFWIGLLMVQMQLSVVAVTCSLMKALEARAFLAVQATLLTSLVVAARLKGPRTPEPPARVSPCVGGACASRTPRPQIWLTLALAVGLALVLLASGLRQLASPLSGSDDRGYHASRVAYWMQHRTIFFPETHNQRQTVFPFGSELWFAWPLLFVKHELVGRMAFWAGLPLGAAAVGTVARVVGLGRTACLAAVLVYAATPVVLLLATSVKSDLWVPVFLLGAAYFAVRGPLVGESRWRRHCLAGMCLALAGSIKMTAMALAPGALLVAALEGGRGNRGRAIGGLGLGLVSGIVLSGLVVLLIGNAIHHGHPLGPPAMNQVHRAELSPHQLYVHAVRTAFTLLELPMVPAAFRPALERAGRAIASRTGADTPLPLEWGWTWPGHFSFSVPPLAVSYSLGGLLWLPCLAVALVPAARVLARWWPRPALNPLSMLAVLQIPLLVGVVLVIRWMDTGSRFWLGAYALSVPVTVFVLTGLGRRWPWARWPIAAALAWTIGVAMADEGRRLEQAIRTPPGPSQTDEPYHDLLPSLPAGARILLVASQNTRDYPLFNPRAGYVNRVFAWDRQPFEAARVEALIEDRRITHVLVENDREVDFQWAGRMKTAEMVAWLCTRPDFHELSPDARPMRLFERTGLPSAGSTPAAARAARPTTTCASESARAQVTLNRTRFGPGETAMVGFDVKNPAFGAPADLYLGVMFPDGHTMVILSRGGGFGPIADRGALRSLTPTEAAPPGFTLYHSAFLRYTFPTAGLEVGTYGVFAALLKPGALTDGRIDPGDVLASDVKTFVLLP